MASSNDNLLTFGLAGKIGNQLVFRRVGDKVIVAKKPSKRKTELKESEIEHRERFKEAVVYADAAMADPILKELYLAYKKPGVSARSAALGDFFTVPKIKTVNVEDYAGKVNDLITARVTEVYEIASVRIEILKADGSPLESGDAMLSANGLDWTYKAKSVNNSLTGTKIIVSAKDPAGNSALQEVML